MRVISIKMHCPLYFTYYKVYCYEFDNQTIVPNGCDFYHPCKECEECLKKSVAIYGGNLPYDT